jgi:hypothetical protein
VAELLYDFLMRDLTPERMYAAALMDGEGWFTIEKKPPGKYNKTPRYTASLGVQMCDKEPLEFMANYFGGEIYFHKNGKDAERRKPSFEWKLSARRAEPAIRTLLPYLKIKRKQRAAQACLDLLDIGSMSGGFKLGVPEELIKKREACYQRVREVNRRGAITS